MKIEDTMNVAKLIEKAVDDVCDAAAKRNSESENGSIIVRVRAQFDNFNDMADLAKKLAKVAIILSIGAHEVSLQSAREELERD